MFKFFCTFQKYNFSTNVNFDFLYFKFIDKAKFEIKTAYKDYLNRILQIITDMKDNIFNFSREFWRCDPEKHTAG